MKRARGSRAAALGAWLGAISAFACGKAAEPQPPAAAERIAHVAQPCGGLELGSEPLDPSNARVFVEVVEVSMRELPKPIGRWLEENTVEVRSSAHAVAFPGVPTTTPWGQCVDAVCSSTELTLTLTARLPERASDPIELALRIERPAREGAASSEAASSTLLETTLGVMNQEPIVLLPSVPAVSDGSLIVTAYLLRRHDDLHRILECKEKQKEIDQGGG